MDDSNWFEYDLRKEGRRGRGRKGVQTSKSNTVRRVVCCSYCTRRGRHGMSKSFGRLGNLNYRRFVVLDINVSGASLTEVGVRPWKPDQAVQRPQRRMGDSSW